MEEIKVGEYVRTKDGYIEKVTNIDNNYVYSDGILSYQFQGDIEIPCSYEEKSKIVKHRLNIIDLIEEDDIGIMRYNGLIFKKFITKDDILELKFKNYELLEIVTKEMFNQVKYEVYKCQD